MRHTHPKSKNLLRSAYRQFRSEPPGLTTQTLRRTAAGTQTTHQQNQRAPALTKGGLHQKRAKHTASETFLKEKQTKVWL